MQHTILSREPVFETARLAVVVGDATDVDFFYRLWKDPQVMGNVGYPQGLPVSREEIAALLDAQQGQVLDARLVAVRKAGGERIGECKLGAPDIEGLSTTDVKLLPQFWGQGYGTEIKRALVDYLFGRTACRVIEATPNVNNIASIKMQEAVGGVRVGERRYEPSEEMHDVARPVHCYVYHVNRDKWRGRG